MEEKNSYLSADPETIRQIDEKMPPEEELQDLAEFFKVFGDATRLKILSVLLCSEMCVYDIATLLGMSQSAISHQLRVLKQMDLVKNRRDGKPQAECLRLLLCYYSVTIQSSIAKSHLRCFLFAHTSCFAKEI